MSPRSSLLVLPLVIGLALSTGACGIPLAVTAGSYAVDGGLAMTTNKTSGDHFASMVTKEDCSFWRAFRHQAICKDRADGHDPYHVNYDEPFRDQSESGVRYGPPLHAAPDAPAASWDAAAYKPSPPQSPSGPTTAVADASPASIPDPVVVETPPAPVAAAAAPSRPPAPKKKAVAHARAKKPSPSQVASAR